MASLEKEILTQRQDIILAGDFNINLLDFDVNKKVNFFVNLMFRFGIILIINKPKRVTRQTVSEIVCINLIVSLQTL